MKTIAIENKSELTDDQKFMLRAKELRAELIANGVTVSDAVKRTIEEVKNYAKAKTHKDELAALQRLAVPVIELRLLVEDKLGEPSLSGESFEYRSVVSEAFKAGGAPDNLGAALRYWASERKAELGLAKKSHRQIARTARAMISNGLVSDANLAIELMELMSTRLDDLGELDHVSIEQAEEFKRIGNDIRRKARTISERAARKVA